MNLPVLALSLLMAAPYTEADARAYMEAMRKDARRNMSVDPVDGAYFYKLTTQLKAKRVLEIGTSQSGP